jgi:hypothetical protein
MHGVQILGQNENMLLSGGSAYSSAVLVTCFESWQLCRAQTAFVSGCTIKPNLGFTEN